MTYSYKILTEYGWKQEHSCLSCYIFSEFTLLCSRLKDLSHV